jgi:flagellar hook-associated protein 2
MATGVLGLGSGQAAALNNELLDNLKAADRAFTVAPIETSIENISAERDVVAGISTKLQEFLDTVKPFDLFVTGGVTAFEQKAATTSGDSVTFDAADVKSLNKGFTSVTVTQLAQKDVYQSNIISDIITPLTGIGDLTIGAETFTTEGKTYQELATEITNKTGMNASLEQVGTDSFRLVIKSEDTGLANKLTISGDASAALGFDIAANNILAAKDLNATVDGVEYENSSNTIIVDGLKITANKLGDSSINITEDNTQIETQMQNFVTRYNELVSLIDEEVSNSDSVLGDKSSIRNIVTQVKDKLFGSYGSAGDKSIFNYGMEIDMYGSLSLDSTKFNDAVQNDMSGLKDLFVGSAEKKGLGTILKETIDKMDFSGGILDTYESSMTSRETSLTKEKDKAEASLNAKYEQLALQFSSYGTIINQMETSFSGLKLLINQSVATN